MFEVSTEARCVACAARVELDRLRDAVLVSEERADDGDACYVLEQLGACAMCGAGRFRVEARVSVT